MKSSNLLSADLVLASKASTTASSSKSASVTNNTVTESSSVDKLTDKSTYTDRFSSEYKAAVKGDKDPSPEMTKKASNDNLVAYNQTVDIKKQSDEVSTLEIKDHTDVSLDSENTAVSDVVSISDGSLTDASVINGSEQKTAVDTESKEQVMADGEVFLSQLSVSNKQLSTPSDQDGKLLPSPEKMKDVEQSSTLQSGSQKNDTQGGGESLDSIAVARNSYVQPKNNLSEQQEQLTETQELGGLSDDELARVFTSSSVNTDSQKNDGQGVITSDTVTESENVDADVSSPDTGQLAMAGALMMPSNEQAISATKNTSTSVQAEIAASIPWSTSSSAAASTGAAALITESDNTDGAQTKEMNSAVANVGLTTGTDSALNNMTQNTDNKASDFSQQLSSVSGQQGGLNMQAKSEALAQAQSPLQLSKDQAGDQVSERINMMMSKNLKHVDIRLDPPELGKLQIRLSINQDQASVQFTVGNQQTRDLVEHSMPRLREMLHQQGLQLAQSSVQQDASRQAFSGQSGQQNQNDSGTPQSGNHSGNGSHAGGDNHDDNIMLGGEAVDMYVKPADDRVDYYA